MNQINQKTPVEKIIAPGKERSYNDIVELLDQNWHRSNDSSKITKIDQALESPSKKIKSVLVAGTNGKSLTMHFATKLLKEEGISVGAFYAPHILTYNERIAVNSETISNKSFTDIANEVLDTAALQDVQLNSFELLTLIALTYFARNNVDVALLEGCEDHVNTLKLCTPDITAITRVTPDKQEKATEQVAEILKNIPTGSWVVSADQSKLNLQTMLELTNAKGAQWAMPIRKLAPLNYPFEQLHGRCAALAERIAYIFVNQIAHKDAVIVSSSLLTKPKAQRGRPTLEAKRQAELNPQKTLEQFWKEHHETLPARFQILDKEKPTVMLDTADNVDAIKNLLLGIRLLHYQRPLQGLTMILGGTNEAIDMEELLKQLRYFFKKTSGQVVVCPTQSAPGQSGKTSWDVEKLTNDLRSMKIKATASKTFKEAFDTACKTVDSKHGLIVITGSPAIVTDYWQDYKGMKKL